MIEDKITKIHLFQAFTRLCRKCVYLKRDPSKTEIDYISDKIDLLIKRRVNEEINKPKNQREETYVF